MQDINEGKEWTQTDDIDLRFGATFLCRPSEEVMKRVAELGLRWDGTRH
jgi:hypothetical protein